MTTPLDVDTDARRRRPPKARRLLGCFLVCACVAGGQTLLGVILVAASVTGWCDPAGAWAASPACGPEAAALAPAGVAALLASAPCAAFLAHGSGPPLALLAAPVLLAGLSVGLVVGAVREPATYAVTAVVCAPIGLVAGAVLASTVRRTGVRWLVLGGVAVDGTRFVHSPWNDDRRGRRRPATTREWCLVVPVATAGLVVGGWMGATAAGIG